MQAVTFEQLGGPEALRLREIDEPQLRANQVLVRVQAVAVDHVDTFVRSGAFQTALATPHVVGRDLVGTVLRVAAGVTKFAVGDLVWTNSAGYDGRMGGDRRNGGGCCRPALSGAMRCGRPPTGGGGPFGRDGRDCVARRHATNPRAGHPNRGGGRERRP